jgi:hypothetical protein
MESWELDYKTIQTYFQQEGKLNRANGACFFVFLAVCEYTYGMTLYPQIIPMSFKQSKISSPYRSKTSVFKYLTVFFLWVTCVMLMAQAFEIDTNLSNAVQYISQIFLTEDGSNTSTWHIFLDGTNGNIVSDGFISKWTEVAASGNYATAMGAFTKSNGFASVAMWNNSIASWDSSTAMGSYTQANGGWSTAIGNATLASGDSSTALWSSTQAIGYVATAMGSYTQANGDYATAMGWWTVANGNSSATIWRSTEASGDYSTAMGYGSIALWSASFAAWNTTNAIGYASTTFGKNTIASGDYSTAMGKWTIANNQSSMAIGFYNSGYINAIFEVGNWGSDVLRSNAFAVRSQWWAQIGDSTIWCNPGSPAYFGTIKFSWDNFYGCTASSGWVLLNYNP